MLLKWDQVLGTEETNSFLLELASVHAHRIIDADLKLYLLLLIKQRKVEELCGLELPLGRYTYSDAGCAAQVVALFSKREDLDLGIDREKVAFGKFLESEQLCFETNEIFKLWARGKFQFSRDVERVLFHAQRKIARCLGDVPSLEALKARFGPGATTQVTRRIASARRKLSTTFACSEELAPFLPEVLGQLPFWVSSQELPGCDPFRAYVPVEIHPGRLSFVPKSAKTDRSIVVEPSLNSFFQLGVGDYIASRLRILGVDITDQTRNQELARLGSLYGELATLDLSSASDTVARELVAHLLPYDWFVFLDKFRTGTVEYGDCQMKLHKFSSMGNGFTFPLETLIFWAIASTASELNRANGPVSVYGDDIILPTVAVPLCRETLTACGFLLNERKSFWSGPFRESCGKDYHSGILIRPVFVKDRISGEDIFRLHNFFVRELDPESASLCLSIVAPQVQLWGPDGFGDGHLISGSPLQSYNERYPNKKHLGYSGFVFDTYTWRSRKCFSALSGDYVYPSYSIYISEGAPRGIHPDVSLLAKVGRSIFAEIFGEERLSEVVRSIQGSDSPASSYDKRTGSFGVTLPGTRGYKRISIYTLTP